MGTPPSSLMSLTSMTRKIICAAVLLTAGFWTTFSNAKITVISTMCQNGPSKWMKCPHEAKRRPTTTEEFLDNLNADDSEQKFCCGDFENRFCCSFAEKLREVPGFDPGTHEDSSVRYRFHHVERFPFGGFLVYLFWFFLIVFIFTAITYIFGCALFEKKSTKDYDEIKAGKSSPYPDTNLAINSNSMCHTIGCPPPNYNSVSRPYNFGGTADLYQNVTQTRNSELPAPPLYQKQDSRN